MRGLFITLGIVIAIVIIWIVALRLAVQDTPQLREPILKPGIPSVKQAIPQR